MTAVFKNDPIWLRMLKEKLINATTLAIAKTQLVLKKIFAFLLCKPVSLSCCRLAIQVLIFFAGKLQVSRDSQVLMLVW